MPADRGGDDRHAAGHRLQRHDPERLVPGHADHDVGRAQQRRQRVAADAAAEVHAVGDAVRARPARAAGAPRGRRRARRAAGRRRSRARRPGSSRERLMTLPMPLRSHQRGRRRRRRRARRRAARRARRGGSASRSTPHGTTAIRRGRRPSRSSSKTSSVQVATTRSARRDDARARARAAPAGLVSASPWWRRLTTPSAWNVCTTGSRASARGVQRGEPGHPEVGVHDVGRLVAPSARSSSSAKSPMCGEQLVLGHGARRARRRRGRPRRRARARRVAGSAGSSRRVWTTTVVRRAGASARGQRRDVHVLAAGVDAAEDGERARVLGDHGDPHRATSASSPSQSARKRSSPKRSSARRRAGARAPRALRVGQERARGVGQHVDARGDDAGCGRDRIRRLCRRQRDDRHAELHRLDQRESQRGPADRVQIDAPPGELVVQAVLRQVVDRMHWPGDVAAVHAEQVDRRMPSAKRASRSVPVTRARRARLVDHDGRALGARRV